MGLNLDSKFDPQIIESHLRIYFAARPNNFQFQRSVGNGAGANVWLLRHRKQAGDQWDRIVVKTPLGIAASGYDLDPMDTTRTRHLVRLIKFRRNDDPLRQDGAREFFKKWIYLEDLPHGTLGELTRKCATHRVAHLPNRLLWRIFMCLVRACVALAYVPDVPADRYDENEEPCAVHKKSVGYSHNDLHTDNIMIGDMLSDADDVEHSISPVVKFIDLEVIQQYPGGGEGRGVERNLEFVATDMAELITFKTLTGIGMLDDDDDDDVETYKSSRSAWLEPGGGRDGFATAAKQLLPKPGDPLAQMPAPWLDPDLRRLLCECAAVDGRRRPRLRDGLLPQVLEAVRTRNAAYYRRAGYGEAGGEEDAAILDLLQRLLGAAPPPPPVPVPGEEDGEGPESMEIDSPAAGGSSRRRDRDRRSDALAALRQECT
ncbi:uncharacterized protein PG986_014749 [Apiospora aurea]|uniref:Protein kinase domain-containing protein n=1 Tax=Apiospora aurea TaxID=335848 RepID=A0ABR1PTV9_9PEZI